MTEVNMNRAILQLAIKKDTSVDWLKHLGTLSLFHAYTNRKFKYHEEFPSAFG